MAELTYDYVSDEEDGTEQLKGRWVARRPSWRSREANELMERLQRKVDQSADRPRYQRVEGPISTRDLPKKFVRWAISQPQSTR